MSENVTSPSQFATSNGVRWHGGYIVPQIEVYIILWGQGTFIPQLAADASPPSVKTFVDEVLNNNAYWDWLKEYDDPNLKWAIGHGGYKGHFTITPRTTATTLTDSDIRSELMFQIDNGRIAAPTTQDGFFWNTYYEFHFPAGITLSAFSQTSCVNWCAYHSSVRWSAANPLGYRDAFYGVFPSIDPTGPCRLTCGGVDPFRSLTNVISHELVETVTDPVNGNGWWDDTTGMEISDICSWQMGTISGSDGFNYTVQQQWSNVLGACVVVNPSNGACSNVRCDKSKRCIQGQCVDPCAACTSDQICVAGNCFKALPCNTVKQSTVASTPLSNIMQLSVPATTAVNVSTCNSATRVDTTLRVDASVSTDAGSLCPSNTVASVLQFASLAAGTHTLAVSGPTSSTVAVSSSCASTVSTSWSFGIDGNINTAAFASQITLIATFGASASGSVSFTEGGTNRGSAQINQGTASLTIDVRGNVGSETISATFSGDSSTKSLAFTVSQGSSSVGLSTPQTLVQISFGQLALTASVTPSTATGTIRFTDNVNTFSAAISGGQATLTNSQFGAGTRNIRAIYDGNSNLVGATSDSISVTIAQASSTTSFSVSNSRPSTGQAVVLSATVSPVGSSSVIFLDGSNQIASSGLDSQGRASASISSLSSGSHTLSAHYSGDSNVAASDSTSIVVTVSAGPLPSLSISTSSSVTSPVFGQPIVLSSTLNPTSPTGTITYVDGTNTVGTATISSGKASTQLSQLTVGSHSVQPTYINPSFQVSAPAVALNVAKAPVTVTLTSSAAPTVINSPVTLTATISSTFLSTPSTTGTITFTDNGATFSTQSVTSNQIAVSRTFTQMGTRNIQASYSGDSNFLNSVGTFSQSITQCTCNPRCTACPANNQICQGTSCVAGSCAKMPNNLAPFGTTCPTATVRSTCTICVPNNLSISKGTSLMFAITLDSTCPKVMNPTTSNPQVFINQNVAGASVAAGIDTTGSGTITVRVTAGTTTGAMKLSAIWCFGNTFAAVNNVNVNIVN